MLETDKERERKNRKGKKGKNTTKEENGRREREERANRRIEEGIEIEREMKQRSEDIESQERIKKVRESRYA